MRAANTHQRHARHQTMRKMKRNFSHARPGLDTQNSLLERTRTEKTNSLSERFQGAQLRTEQNKQTLCTSGAS